ncbi:MAG TPA: tRNA lysidine(34) synthetase TilS, partial [Thermomicrobiales bacterium]|nr:tRNA lysidine(34) synthetase TilS [Thermomicrobiales bacterium]
LQRRLARLAWRAAGGAGDLPAAPVEAARRAVADGRTGARVALPGDVLLLVERDRAAWGPAATLEARLRDWLGLPLVAPGYARPIAGPGVVALAGGWALAVSAGAGAADGADAVSLPPAGADGPGWEARTWRDGDRVRLRGGGTQKLQDWFVDRHVPAYARRRLVLLARGDTVHWVAGLGVPGGARVDSTGLVVRLIHPEQTAESPPADE